MQGVWLTNTDSKLLHSRQSLETGLRQLQKLGFDTIYPVVWYRGYTLYPSLIAEKYTGHLTLPQTEYSSRDYLAELLEISHSLGLRVIAWWEYGLMLPPNCELVQRYPSCLTLTNTGDRLRRKTASAQLDQCVWLNPSDPQVIVMMGELVTDLVSRYPIDGIQFDDHWGWPVELGFEPATQAAYRQSATGIWPFSRHSTWADWAGDRLTDAFQQVVGKIKATNPSCLISLSPNPLRFSIDNYRMNWQHWQELGLIDELVLQVYRYDLPSFQTELNKPELQNLPEKIAIGILTGLTGKNQPPELIQQQITAVKRQGFKGFVCFFSETVMAAGNIFSN
jgi:uncharacterized lipoprotein YddW (UPF0748 family)